MPSGWTSWKAWQWSDSGSVPGISGHVDLDLFNGDEAALSAWGGAAACNGPVGHPLGSDINLSGGTCPGAAPAVTAPSACGKMTAGEGLKKGHTLTSCDGRFELAMQTDGNLVEYSNGIALWASHTVNGGDTVVMQGDGNLVVYGATGCPVWASQTAGNAGGFFQLQSDGNLVVYNASSQAKWATGTGSIGAKPSACGEVKAGEGLAPGETVSACGGCFSVTMQSDGNLVLYKKAGGALWSSATAGSTGYTLDMASGGDLTLWSKEGCPLWSTNTGGHTGSKFAVQDDGNLVVYDATNHPIWASSTVSCQGGCNCNPPPPPPMDAGMPPPPPHDAGTPMTMDAGSTMSHDAGTTGHDAGAPVEDGGSQMSEPDAGPGGEMLPGDDAGSPPTHHADAGEPPPEQMMGGCSAAGGLELSALLALISLLRRRRSA
jgi:hypothetical protein